jgi:hypothetical protein
MSRAFLIIPLYGIFERQHCTGKGHISSCQGLGFTGGPATRGSNSFGATALVWVLVVVRATQLYVIKTCKTVP